MRYGIFDSGVGGLTVLRELTRLAPDASFVYFGDTARCPYGNKSADTITRYAMENSAFLIAQGIDALVVACNTASSLALAALQEACTIPVVGVILPAAQAACAASRSKRIGVIGTKSTIASGAYQEAIRTHCPTATTIGQACPLLVPFVEEQRVGDPLVQQLLREYLAPLRAQQIDTLVLGCTHYPFLAPLIQEELGDDVVIVDPSCTCAHEVATLQHCLMPATCMPPHQRFYVSDDPERFREVGEAFLGRPLHEVRLRA